MSAPEDERCECPGGAPWPAWSCDACGKRDPDWQNRRRGVRCDACGIDVPLVHADCQVCNAHLHAYPLGSAQCAANEGCHGRHALHVVEDG